MIKHVFSINVMYLQNLATLLKFCLFTLLYLTSTTISAIFSSKTLFNTVFGDVSVEICST